MSYLVVAYGIVFATLIAYYLWLRASRSSLDKDRR